MKKISGLLAQLFILSIFVGTCIFSINSFATDSSTVASVKIEGNERIEDEAILAVVKTKKGDIFDHEQLDTDLRNIYRMDYFTDVSIDVSEGEDGKIVIFKVKEKPSIGKIVFKGNEKQKEEDLKEELGIALYSILDQNEVKQSINRLKDYYRQKGYYNAEIKEKIEPMANNEVLLEYQITEHEKVYVTKITIKGNKKFDEDEILDLMETREKGFFSWITDKGVLDMKKLEFDIHKITAYYHNNGFIRVQVSDPKIDFDKDKGLTITIEISEGEQFKVNKVNISGDLIKSEEELLKSVKIKDEKVFKRGTVREDIQELSSIYSDEGYAFVEVIPKAKEDDKALLVDITYNIEKGKKIRFERINIFGNTITRDKVIRRELKVLEGDYYSGMELRKSSENIDRLGFFEDVSMNTRKGSQDDLLILDLKVKEKPTGSFSVGAGYSSEDSAFVMFQLAQNNLFGTAQKLQSSARLGGKSTQFDIKYVEPWLMDTPISLSVDIYKWKQEYDDYSIDGIDYEDYSRDSAGSRLGIGFPVDNVDEYTRGFVSYGYDNSNISNVPDDADEELQDMEGRNITSSITVGVSRDSRDKPWNTTKGSSSKISLEHAGSGLGGDVYFDKITVSSAKYIPAFWKTVFMIRGNWGYIFDNSGGKLPIYQKFRLGGINSIRGFSGGSISPRSEIREKVDEFNNVVLDSYGNPVMIGGERIGGRHMMYFNFEHRFPLFTEQGLMGLVFFDTGNVYGEGENFSLRGLKRSAGLGIRWYSPMGPLRLEYGHNLNKQEGEKSGKWEFSVGGLF